MSGPDGGFMLVCISGMEKVEVGYKSGCKVGHMGFIGLSISLLISHWNSFFAYSQNM